jgi:hypothetical protein
LLYTFLDNLRTLGRHQLSCFLQLSLKFPLGLFWWDRGQVLAKLLQILENAALDLVLLLQFLFVQPQLFSGKLTRAVISVLVTVGAKHDEIL